MRISDWSSDVCSSDLNLVAGRADVGRNRGADLERTVNLAALDVQVERRDKVEIILVGRRRAKVFLGDADDLDRRILVELVRPEGHLDAVAVLDNPAVLADDRRIPHHPGLDAQDRKRGVQGKSVSVSGNLGGRG